jgi:transposase
VLLADDVLVAKGYRLVQRDQQFLMPESMRDWLPPSDPVWLVIGVVAGLDTSGLHAKRRTGGAGRAGYDPDMLLTLLIWAWAQGIRSSRVIERLCQRDVGFRIICGGDGPDHVTISRFRAEAADVVGELFTQVLVLCARLGIGQLGVVALDSVKIASNASLAANRTEDGLRKAAAEQVEIDAAKARELAAAAAAEHAATDDAEDALYGPDRCGDEVPEELIDPRSRSARIAQALEELAADNAEREAKLGAKQAEREAKRQAKAPSKREVQRAAAAERRRHREQDRQERRAAQLEEFRRRCEQRAIEPMGLPPLEIRVEILTQNLAEARARHQVKIDRYHARGKKGRRPVPVEQAYRVMRIQAALDRAIAAEAAAHQRKQAAESARQPRPASSAPVAEQAAASPTGSTSGEPQRPSSEPKRNITDPQSRMMPLRGGGWLQGYNCQAVTSSDGLIIANGVGNNPNDTTAFTEMMDQAVAAAELIDTHKPTAGQPAGIGVLLADAGYHSEDNLTAPGPDRLIAVGKSRDLAAAAREHPTAGPPPPQATPTEAMAHRLRTPEGHALYSQRSHIAETPFAHAKHNIGFRRFTSRGIARATAEFTFHALVHNLLKAMGTGRLVPAAC